MEIEHGGGVGGGGKWWLAGYLESVLSVLIVRALSVRPQRERLLENFMNQFCGGTGVHFYGLRAFVDQ